MDRWERKALGDIITLKRGHDLPIQKRLSGDYPVYSSSGITGSHNTFISEDEGVITGRYGTIGQVFYSDTPYWPLNTTLYVDDFKGNHPKFVYYLLKALNWDAFSVASAVPGINRNHVHKAVVLIPDVATQKYIAEVLSLFDEKIKNNTAINHNLAA